MKKRPLIIVGRQNWKIFKADRTIKSFGNSDLVCIGDSRAAPLI